jgi:hypothetical protein
LCYATKKPGGETTYGAIGDIHGQDRRMTALLSEPGTIGFATPVEDGTGRLRNHSAKNPITAVFDCGARIEGPLVAYGRDGEPGLDGDYFVAAGT